MVPGLRYAELGAVIPFVLAAMIQFPDETEYISGQPPL